jgi:uncharacterized protein YndB with AHSA1/START domain
MGFQDDPQVVQWRLHLKSSPSAVFEMLTSNQGRSRFWAESTAEVDGKVLFRFSNGQEWCGKIIEQTAPRRFVIEYFGGSIATFELCDDAYGGTELNLRDAGVPAEHRMEVIAGWASVLLALKAAVDFGVDLRNHDPQRTWDDGYVDN